MNTNPMQIIQMLKSGGNPQQVALSMLQSQTNNNPFMQNLLSLAQNGKGADIESIARNMLKEQGYDFDTEFKKFKDTFGL